MPIRYGVFYHHHHLHQHYHYYHDSQYQYHYHIGIERSEQTMEINSLDQQDFFFFVLFFFFILEFISSLGNYRYRQCFGTKNPKQLAITLSTLSLNLVLIAVATSKAKLFSLRSNHLPHIFRPCVDSSLLFFTSFCALSDYFETMCMLHTCASVHVYVRVCILQSECDTRKTHDSSHIHKKNNTFVCGRFVVQPVADTDTLSINVLYIERISAVCCT